MWFSKISSSRSLCKGPVVYSAENEEVYDIVPYQKFFMVTLLLKRTLQHVSHIQIVLWVSRSKWVNRCNPLSTPACTENRYIKLYCIHIYDNINLNRTKHIHLTASYYYCNKLIIILQCTNKTI